MRTALAFVCCLLLAWTNIVLPQASGASVVSARPSCCCGKKTSCCAAKNSQPESSPVPATPVTSLQNHLSLLAPATVAWALPSGAARELPSSFSPTSVTAGTALFERNCAWLI